jgi:hypothetical protein
MLKEKQSARAGKSLREQKKRKTTTATTTDCVE